MKLIAVTCISERKNWDEPVVGNTYLIDTDSLYIDYEGDTYVDVYDIEKIGMLKASHFMSI